MLRCDPDERGPMIESQPDVFWTTPHYAGHPMVPVHLEAIGDDELLDRIAGRVADRPAAARGDAQRSRL